MSLPLIFGAAAVGIGSIAWFRNRSVKAEKGVFSAFGWQTLRLDSYEDLNSYTRKLRFALPDPNKPSGLPLTSALLTIAKPSHCRSFVIRPYTPVNHRDEPGYIELIVRNYSTGKMSPHMHRLKPGDTITFVGPIPGLSWTPNKHPQLTMLAGGAGITPMYQLIRGVLKNPEDKTRINMVWGCKEEDGMFLKDEFDALEKQHPGRFKVTYILELPRDRKQTAHRMGLLDQKALEELGLDAKKEANKDTKVLVCGPPKMIKMLQGYNNFGTPVVGVLEKLGYNRDQVHYF
ncbi:hypothetical protein N0V88_003245 [Collariella sp. IMI 366227]|nr:hypothetical protein N0V88_003245 [Collariella sp. IMI 366227]